MQLNKATMQVKTDSGPNKYKAEMAQYEWGQKLKSVSAEVEAQRKKVAAANAKRAKYSLDKLTLNDDHLTPTVHTSIDALRAQVALRQSQDAKVKAEHIAAYAAAVVARKKQQVQHSYKGVIHSWEKVEDVIDGHGIDHTN